MIRDRQPELRRQPRAARHHAWTWTTAGSRRFIGPSGCGKSTPAALPQPDERPDRQRARSPGRMTVHGPRHQRGHHRRDRGAPADRDGLPEVEPLPEVDLRERGLRPAHRRHQRQGRSCDEACERSLRGRGAVGRGEGPAASESGLGLSGGQMQRLCIARAIAVGARDHRSWTSPARRSIPSPRSKIEELIYSLKDKLHDRDRDPQPAAGGARLGPAPRSSGWAGWWSTG